MEAIQWAIGILVTIQTIVTGFLASALWAHVAPSQRDERSA
jgi:hypothetical protein